MQFENFDSDAFLRDHWQKSPCLIRSPWKEWQNPLTPDELAGLACEEGVESRLVDARPSGWELEHGPLPEDRFGALDKKNWTLLVQAVDQFVPEVAALIAPFRFVPDWRIDDVMVSYAADGGGVGPHFDQYDVFLVQGLGRRRWRVGPKCDDDTPLLPHDDLRLLADFEATDEWVLEPGDMLYVPPGFAHDGVAVGDNCMTYSIGFRAPSQSELIGYWADDMLASLRDDDRYTDADLKAQDNPGEIKSAALDRLHALVLEKLGDRGAFARWFGSYATTPKYGEIEVELPLEEGELREALAGGATLSRNPASRFSFIQSDDGLTLFADGKSFECCGEVAELAVRLCADGGLQMVAEAKISEEAAGLLAQLYQQGSMLFE